jgi:hypothetical protein
MTSSSNRGAFHTTGPDDVERDTYRVTSTTALLKAGVPFGPHETLAEDDERRRRPRLLRLDETVSGIPVTGYTGLGWRGVLASMATPCRRAFPGTP